MSAQIDFETLQQAADWFAQLRADDATDADRESWRAWLAQSSTHRDAWQTIEAVGRRFQPLQNDTDRNLARGALTTLQSRRQLTRRQSLNAIAWLAGGSALALARWRYSPLPTLAAEFNADYRTTTGEIRALTLVDGTQVWLNTASALNVDFQPLLRRLHLLAGEVLIETAHETNRAFVVDTAHGRLRALGTRFAVRQSDSSGHLAVYAGAVEIDTGDTHATRVINAGEQVYFRGDGIDSPTPAQSVRQAWSRGVLLAEDMALSELLAELSRYQRGHLAAAPAVAQLRVMGTFPLRDPDRVLAMLEQALPVTVRRTLPWWTTLEARAESPRG